MDLLEAKRFDLITGIGYQSNKGNLTVPGLDNLHGVRGLVQLTHINMLGKLYTGSMQLRVSETELFGQLSFQNPRPFGTKYPVLFSLFARRLAQRTFLSDRYTALLQAERRFSPDFIVYVAYTFERVSVYDLSPDLSLEEIQRNSQPIRLGRIGPRFARDKTNNRFDPTSGIERWKLRLRIETGSAQRRVCEVTGRTQPLLSDNRFRDTGYSVTGRLGLPRRLWEERPCHLRALLAGGARDLRGFGFEEAGPIIFVPEAGLEWEHSDYSNGTRSRCRVVGRSRGAGEKQRAEISVEGTNWRHRVFRYRQRLRKGQRYEVSESDPNHRLRI